MFVYCSVSHCRLSACTTGRPSHELVLTLDEPSVDQFVGSGQSLPKLDRPWVDQLRGGGEGKQDVG